MITIKILTIIIDDSVQTFVLNNSGRIRRTLCWAFRCLGLCVACCCCCCRCCCCWILLFLNKYYCWAPSTVAPSSLLSKSDGFLTNLSFSPHETMSLQGEIVVVVTLWHHFSSFHGEDLMFCFQNLNFPISLSYFYKNKSHFSHFVFNFYEVFLNMGLSGCQNSNFCGEDLMFIFENLNFTLSFSYFSPTTSPFSHYFS